LELFFNSGGLTAKSRTGVDIEKVEGPKCKMAKIGISRNYFSKGKPVDRGWRRSTVDSGQGLG
jgi:hypothetical protein